MLGEGTAGDQHSYNKAQTETEGPGLSLEGVPGPLVIWCVWKPKVGLVRAIKCPQGSNTRRGKFTEVLINGAL